MGIDFRNFSNLGNDLLVMLNDKAFFSNIFYKFREQGEETKALYILGGDQDGVGTLQDVVYRGENGLLCDINGIVCGGL